MTLTAIIIVSPQEENEDLERAKKSVEWADEVMVVRVEEPITDFSKVRNEAMERAKGEWVMFVDSDEEVSEELASEILRTLLAVRQGESLSEISGAYFRRKDKFLGKWLKHGETAGVRLLRLARKGAGRWERPVHEVWRVRGRTVEMRWPILHYSHESVDEMVEKLDKYSELEAKCRLGKLGKLGKLVLLGEMMVFPAGKFVQNYIFRLGFLDGMEGLIQALMMSGHSFLVRAKLMEKVEPILKPSF